MYDTFFTKPDSAISKIQTAMENIIDETDPYKILNISKQANEREIEKAYKSLALKYHPDKQTDPKLKELADSATNKLNQARKQAKEFCQQSANKKHKQDNTDVMTQFTERMTTITLRSVFDPNAKRNIEWLHGLNEYKLGLMMLWSTSFLKHQQAETLKLIDAGLQYKPLTSDVLKLAEAIHPYVKDNRVSGPNRNNIATILAHDSPLTELNVVTDVDISWSFDNTLMLEMIYDISMRYVDTPIIIHNTTFNSKVSSYLGLYFHEENFYLFDSNQLELTSDKTSLQPLSWQGVSERINRVFFQSESRLLDANAKLTQPISIVTLRSDLKAKKDNMHAIVPISQSHLLSTIIQKAEFTAEEVLQNIADFQLENTLEEVYKNKPICFTPELLARYLQISLNTDNIVLALEICKLDHQQQSEPFRWSRQYINDYLACGRPLALLSSVLICFKQAGLDLASLVTDETKKNGSPALSNCDVKTDAATLDVMLTLGVNMTDAQREKLIVQLSEAIHNVAVRIELEKMLRDDGNCLVAKYHEAIQPYIDVFSVLAKHHYSLTPGDGFPISSHPYYSLRKASKLDVAQRFYEMGLIGLNKVDEKRRTLVNHLTKDKAWEEVRLLLKSGATYSTGQDISADMIPPIAAYFENVYELRELYTGHQFASMLQLETDVGDILCTATSVGKVAFISDILKNGFTDKLRANPIHYLYHCLNPKTVLLLLEKLEPNYLEYASVAALPPALDQFIKVINISCDEETCDHESLELLGLSKHIIDSSVKQLGMANLRKIEVIGSNDVYYLADDALTKKIYTFLAVQVSKKYFDSMMEHIFKSPFNAIPNISFFLNELVKINEVLTYFLETEYLGQLKYILDLDEYLSSHSALPRDKYTNNMAVINYMPKPIGIRINFDANGIAKSYCIINNMALFALKEFIDVEAILPNDNKLSDLRRSIESASLHLYQLKAILEETLGVTFEPVEASSNDMAQYIWLKSYDAFRRGISPNKYFPDIHLELKKPKISEHVPKNDNYKMS